MFSNLIALFLACCPCFFFFCTILLFHIFYSQRFPPTCLSQSVISIHPHLRIIIILPYVIEDEVRDRMIWLRGHCMHCIQCFIILLKEEDNLTMAKNLLSTVRSASFRLLRAQSTWRRENIWELPPLIPPLSEVCNAVVSGPAAVSHPLGVGVPGEKLCTGKMQA